MTHKSKTALFAGSFNPFTIGHKRIVERALQFADKVIVAVGYNIEKGNIADIDRRLGEIRRAFGDDERVEVASYQGLTADFAKKSGADFLLRGVRDVKDFEYERNLADVNLKLLGIDTVILLSEPEYGYISSSTVRELRQNGFDTSALVP